MSQLLLTRAQRKLIRSLHQRKGREAHGLYLVEGVRAVEACLESGAEWRLALVAPGLERMDRGAALRRRLAASGAPTVECSDRELGALAATETPQGVLLVAGLRPTALDQLDPPAVATCVVLDGLQDPGNVGTIIRTAHGLGAYAVIAGPGGADPWGPKAVRAAAGALFYLPVAYSPRSETFDWLKAHGFALWGADVRGEPLRRGERPVRAALVLGNEGAGLSEESRARCDRFVSVPLVASAESLNVAVAAAVLLDRLLHA